MRVQGMPLSKIKGLGGKLGQRLTDGLGATAAGEVAAAPWQQLVGLLEDRARWVPSHPILLRFLATISCVLSFAASQG
jgi:hypothetical protein